MKAVINIKADKEVKEKAQKVARELGMPLSVILNGYLREFIRTKEVHFAAEGKLKPSVKKTPGPPSKRSTGGEERLSRV